MSQPDDRDHIDQVMRAVAQAAEPPEALYARLPALEPLDALLGTVRTSYDQARSALRRELYERKGDTHGLNPLDHEYQGEPVTAAWLALRAELLRAARHVDHLVYGVDPILDR